MTTKQKTKPILTGKRVLETIQPTLENQQQEIQGVKASINDLKDFDGQFNAWSWGIAAKLNDISVRQNKINNDLVFLLEKQRFIMDSLLKLTNSQLVCQQPQQPQRTNLELENQALKKGIELLRAENEGRRALNSYYSRTYGKPKASKN